MGNEETAARLAFARDQDGIRHAGSSTLTYADGSEAGLLTLLRQCANVDSGSLEPLERATSWAERYHTHPARAGVVRAFDIPRDAVVLEVGAGCGGVTRYLGETCGAVDALEPMEARARVARERTRDLPSVEIFVGEIADLPPGPSYDVVVVVGVLEYVGHGSADPKPYIRFLREIRERLRPGGSLILAIENKFGVKYLAGAPEDHTNQVFDSVEGYPRGERARTFSRSELLAMFAEADLDGRTFGAFPDYKLTQAVFDLEHLPKTAWSLAAGVPHFPSPDWTGARPRLASERLLWRELVGAGLAAETPNSFIVVGGRDGPSSLWPAGRLAIELDPEIQPQLARISEFSVEGTLGVTSSPRVPTDRFGESSSQRTRRDFVEGRSVASALATASPTQREEFLLDLCGLMRAEPESDFPLSTSAIVAGDGSIRLVPGTIVLPGFAVENALARVIFWMGIHAAATAPPSQWPGALITRDVVEHLGRLAILAEGWVDRAIERESTLQALVSLRYCGPDAKARWKSELERQLQVPLTAGELGTRDFERVASLSHDLQTLHDSYRRSQDQLADAQREVERLRTILGRRAR